MCDLFSLFRVNPTPWTISRLYEFTMLGVFCYGYNLFYNLLLNLRCNRITKTSWIILDLHLLLSDTVRQLSFFFCTIKRKFVSKSCNSVWCSFPVSAFEESIRQTMFINKPCQAFAEDCRNELKSGFQIFRIIFI